MGVPYPRRMAIKGKRKSQARGSQARRRPAAAPRPVAVARRTPWYRTTAGKVLAGIVLAVIVGVVWWSIARAQDRADALELRQGALETYTRNIQGLLQRVRPPAQAMSNVSGAPDKAVRGLREHAAGWAKSLEKAKTEAARTFAGPSTITAHGLFRSAIDGYLSAAKTYGLAARAKGPLQVNALARAAEQRDAAANVWLGAIQVLDQARESADLGASNLGVPSEPPPVSQPGLPGLPGSGTGGGG